MVSESQAEESLRSRIAALRLGVDPNDPEDGACYVGCGGCLGCLERRLHTIELNRERQPLAVNSSCEDDHEPMRDPHGYVTLGLVVVVALFAAAAVALVVSR